MAAASAAKSAERMDGQIRTGDSGTRQIYGGARTRKDEGYRARMPHRVRVGELLLAIEGLALARHLFGGDPDTVARRVDGLRATLATLDGALETSSTGPEDDGREDDGPVEAFAVELSEAGVSDGYDRWSASYDEAENPLLTVEEPILRDLIADLAPGTALDACTGTGRHAALMSALGHSVTGFDQSARMLELAKAKVPGAVFAEGDLGATPLDGEPFDLVVCALALTHFPSLTQPVAALAALTRSGGRLVLTDMHPMAVLLSGQALFNDAADGGTRFVRNHVHQVSDYLAAFAAAGLTVERCVEHLLAPGEGPMANLAGHLRPEATADAYVGMPYVLAWALTRP
jgi:SAM-dependent methyltransferase